jgi:1-acyl-sn-glycerol-3-phosphate acyltransferase
MTGPITIEQVELPSRVAIFDALHALAGKARAPVHPHDLGARDPEFIARIAPWFDLLYDHYFRCRTELEEELPSGPFLAVGNHNGMSGTPDMYCHMTAFWRRYGVHRPAFGLMHDFPFRTPLAGSWLNASGAIAARPANALAALDRGAAVLVFPGGDIDACRPFRRRYRIELAGRRGFLKIALRAQVPIVPIVSAGAHSSLYIWDDGRRIAERLGLPQRVRSNVFPIGLALPWGVIFGAPLPHLPPPVKIHTRMLRPMRFDLPASAAEDPSVLDQLYTRVEATMQRALDDLRQEGRHGWFPRE